LTLLIKHFNKLPIKLKWKLHGTYKRIL